MTEQLHWCTVNLQPHFRGPQRSCTPTRCQDHFHWLPESSWWPTGRARLSERLATPSTVPPQAVNVRMSVNCGKYMARQEVKRLESGQVYLVCLINDDGVVGECFDHVKVFNGGWRRDEQLTIMHGVTWTEQIVLTWNLLSQSKRTAVSQK